MTIEVRPSSRGVLLPIKAQPGAKRNAIVGEYASRLKVAVTVVAEKGKANAALVKLISRELNISKSHLSITSGETSSLKVIEVIGMSYEDLADRLQALLPNQSIRCL